MKISILFLSLFSSFAIAQNLELSEVKVVANCQAQDYVDLIPGDSLFMITTQGINYSPKCLRIKKGTSIDIQATARHPVQGIQNFESSLINPIYDELGGAVETKTYTFKEPGVFGYYCAAHGNDLGEGMAGAILVVE